MKKYLQTLHLQSFVQKALLVIFIIGFCIGIYQERYDIAADHTIMVILTVTLMINSETINNYKRLTDSYSDLTDAYDVRSNHQREIIAMLKHTIEVKNKDILELQTKNEKLSRKSSSKSAGI